MIYFGMPLYSCGMWKRHIILIIGFIIQFSNEHCKNSILVFLILHEVSIVILIMPSCYEQCVILYFMLIFHQRLFSFTLSYYLELMEQLLMKE